MKRSVVPALLAGAVLAGGAVETVGAKGSAFIPDGKSRARKVTESYTPTEVGVWIITPMDPGASVASAEIDPRPHEKTVSVVVEDDAGTPVRGHIYQQEDGSTRLQFVASFCEKTDEPVTIDPRKAVVVQVFTGLCGGSWGLATTGSVTATFR